MPWAIGTLGKAALNFLRPRRTCFAALIDLTSPVFLLRVLCLSEALQQDYPLWKSAPIELSKSTEYKYVSWMPLSTPVTSFDSDADFKCFRLTDKNKPSQNVDPPKANKPWLYLLHLLPRLIPYCTIVHVILA